MDNAQIGSMVISPVVRATNATLPADVNKAYLIRGFTISVQAAADGTFTATYIDCTPYNSASAITIARIAGITGTATRETISENNLWILCKPNTAVTLAAAGALGTGGSTNVILYYNEVTVSDN